MTINREPVIYSALAVALAIALFAVASHYGYMDSSKADAIIGAVVLVLGWFVRQRVTPTAAPRVKVGSKLLPARIVPLQASRKK